MMWCKVLECAGMSRNFDDTTMTSVDTKDISIQTESVEEKSCKWFEYCDGAASTNCGLV